MKLLYLYMKNFSVIRRKLSNFCYVNHESTEFREGLASILRDYLNGDWQKATSSNLCVQKLRGGMSNSVFLVSLPTRDEKSNESKAVIARFHQELKIDSVHEHVTESLAFMLLSEKKFGPKLLAVFPGGRIEEYINARALKTSELSEKRFSLAIAEKMALVHSMNLPLAKKNGLMFDIMDKSLMKILEISNSWKCDNFEKEKCLKNMKQLQLKGEISWLRNFLMDVNSPTVFCHNDLQEGNILVKYNSVSAKKPNLIFIDYEYCFYNYRGFELANHFLEYTMNYESKTHPYFDIKLENYPSEEQQLVFLRRYLSVGKYIEELAKHEQNILDFTNMEDKIKERKEDKMEIELLSETKNFRLASHLFWAIWAALRFRSDISFGYWEYSNARLEEYFKTKDELQGKDKP